MTDEEREKLIKLANQFNPFTTINGIMLTEVTDDYAIVEHEIKRESLNIYGSVHGGLIASMIDYAGGVMARCDGRTHVTSSMEVKFIGNVTEGRLVAKSELINRGKKLCNIRIRVTAEDGNKLIAEGMTTYFCIDEE